MVKFRIAALFRPAYLAAACQWATGACAPKTCIPGPPFSLVYQAYQASLKTWPYYKWENQVTCIFIVSMHFY